MNKFFITLLAALFVFGSFAKGPAKITTVKVGIPARISIVQDSLFSVESETPDLQYEIKNDTILKISRKGSWDDDLNYDDSVKILIKTPQKLNVETSRYLKIKSK
jgi:hypothetical protein